MKRGRPPRGPGMVDDLDGDDDVKQRLRVVLETISGEKTIVEACAELGICEARFHKIRDAALRSALEGLSPRSPGRPPKSSKEKDGKIQALKGQVDELKVELKTLKVKLELAKFLPEEMIGEEPMIKKKQRPKKGVKKGKRK